MSKIPETRTSVEYQFTPIPSEALERLAAVKLTGREFRIILAVMRKTWGWSKEKDKISMSQFARFTGIDRRKCHIILTSLIKQKIIKKTVAANGDRKIINYSFNEVYAEWKLLPPMGTKAKRKVVAANGDTMLPPKGTKLSPPAAHTIDKDRNLSTESGEAPPEILKSQGASPYTGTDDGMTSICTRCGKEAETVLQNGERLCIYCFKKDDRPPVSQFTEGIGRHLNA